jgi:drug/metabolite transporter (DMT)-like permease
MQVLWMVLAAFFFATMGVSIKFAAEHFNTAEIIFYRGLISMALLWALARGQGVSLRTRHPMMHAWRSLVGVVSMAAWFYAIAKLPLATAMTLNYMSSLWIAAFMVGGALMAWRPSPETPRPALHTPVMVSLLVGFVGVVLMMRPSLGADQALAGVVGLMSGMIAALAYMQVVALSRLGEPEQRVVFYFSVGSAVAGGVAMPFVGISDFAGWHTLWLLPVGLFAAGGQLCMTRAYANAMTRRATLVVANLQYSGIAFGGAYSVLVFGDVIEPMGWIGMALIVGSGIAATVLRSRN